MTSPMYGDVRIYPSLPPPDTRKALKSAAFIMGQPAFTPTRNLRNLAIAILGKR